MSVSTRTPFAVQFLVAISGSGTKSVSTRDYIPEIDTAQSYGFPGYQLRLIASASTDVDVLAGKKIGLLSVSWGDASTALFPLAREGNVSEPQRLTFAIGSRSAHQPLAFSLSGVDAASESQFLISIEASDVF